jgi:hypothetical protein
MCPLKRVAPADVGASHGGEGLSNSYRTKYTTEKQPASITEAEIGSEHLKGRSLTQNELDQFKTLGIDGLCLGTPWPVLADSVVFSNNTFEFTRHVGGESSSPAYIIGVLGFGGLIDLVAWEPASFHIASWLGRAFAISEQQIEAPHLEPLPVWRSPLEWLRAGRRGIVILRPEIAWSRLADVPVLAETVEDGLELRRLLSPPLKPRIFVRSSHAGTSA